LADARVGAEPLVRRALALDVTDAEARTLLGRLLHNRGDRNGALAEIDRALALSPNLEMAHGMRGSTLIFSGRHEEGIAALVRSIRLDPAGPNLAIYLAQISMAHYLAGAYEAAIEAAKATIRSYPNHPMAYRWLAAALGQIGQIEQAKEALEASLTLAPASFDMLVRRRVPWMRPEDYEHEIEGLRKAGWQG
jgi:adenylate cyclase